MSDIWQFLLAFGIFFILILLFYFIFVVVIPYLLKDTSEDDVSDNK